MYRWTGGLGLLLGIAFTVSPHSTGKCQDLKPKFHLETSTGVSFYDDELSFESSPFVGLGAGYRISKFFELNLGLRVSPTRQRIAAAASELTTDVNVFNYSVALEFSKPEPIFSRFRPFATLGTGGIVFDPEAVLLDLGGGESLRLQPEMDHQLSFLLAGGLGFSLSRRFELRFEYQRVLHNTKQVLDDAVTTKTVTASNHLWGIGLSTSF